MHLTKRDIELFKGLKGNAQGGALVDYLERLKKDIWDPEKVNSQNFEHLKAICLLIDEHLINPIRRAGERKGDESFD